MNRLHYFRAVVELLDITLSTRSKRHLVGGGLLGLSLLFGTFAVTVMTAQSENKEEHNDGEYLSHIPDGPVDIFSGMPGGVSDDVFDPEETF